MIFVSEEHLHLLNCGSPDGVIVIQQEWDNSKNVSDLEKLELIEWVQSRAILEMQAMVLKQISYC